MHLLLYPHDKKQKNRRIDRLARQDNIVKRDLHRNHYSPEAEDKKFHGRLRPCRKVHNAP